MECTPQQVIDFALQLSPQERSAVVVAIQESLVDPNIDHGPQEPADEVAAAWSAEIARRIEDIEAGRVELIPSEEAWKMIRGEKPLSF